MLGTQEGRRHDGALWFLLLRVPEILLGLLVASLVLFLTFSVFARYVLSFGMAWSDEAARLLFVWTVFLGFAVGLKHRGNIGVELVVDRLPAAWKRRAIVFQDLAILVFSLVFLWQSVITVKFSFLQRLPALQVSIAWLYFAVLIGSILMTIYAVANLWETLRGAAVPAAAGEDAFRRAD
jgi:TRAP-type C4-dicarboxylate transport system permease small subunit